MNKFGVIFDLDGTLWDTTNQVVPAWNRVLSQYSNLNRQISIDEMHGFMGENIEKIGSSILPDIDFENRMKIIHKCCREETIYLKEKGGELYPETEATIESLSQKYNLYIVSNCQEDYLNAFFEYHNLRKYIKDYETAGKTKATKGENIKKLIERNGLSKTVYVGDTGSDYDAAQYAGCFFIFAQYGFGKVDNADYSIKNIGSIVNLIPKIFNNSKYYTYILRCRDNSLYTGICTNVKRRMDEHFSQGEKCAKYTRTHTPKKLEAVWESDCRVSASKLEYRIKRLSKQQKEKLIADNDFSCLSESVISANFKRICIE